MKSRSALFDEAFLRRLEHLDLVTRRPVAGHLRGAHRSRRTGTGMVFADYRPYSEGDDTRNLDWGIYLRLDRLILRLFEEEADLPVYLLLDTSASMNYGAPRKFDFARQIVAALGYLALRNYDRVSAVAWADGVAKELASRRGRTQVWPLFSFLEGLEPASGTDLLASLRGTFGASRTRGLVILVSDFLDEGAFTEATRWLRQFRHEVVAFHVLSPQEFEPDLPDQVELVDEETRQPLVLDGTLPLVEAYKQELARHCSSIEDACRREGWSYLMARTDTPFEDLMLMSLRRAGVLR